MARYAVGDIQGCYEEFRELLTLIEFNPYSDKVYLVGDLVNRGPKSLEVLRYVKEHCPAFEVVLGNHDLHLLACWAGVAKVKGLDTLDGVLCASDVDELMNWLRKQPLLIDTSDFIIAHAGINPSVPFEVLKEVAHFCGEKLAGDDYVYWLRSMYGNTPTQLSEDFTMLELFRYGINSFTRMRMLDNSELDFKYKGEVATAAENLKPWFDFATGNKKKIIFGLWSALGLIVSEKIISLDTACIWGGQLTAICFDNDTLYQVPAFSVSNSCGD